VTVRTFRALTALIAALTIAASAGMTALFAQSRGNAAAGPRSDSGTWTIVPQSDGNLGMSFSLGWTLGTHEGRASKVSGSLQAQLNPLTVGQGEFRIPIAAMSTGSVTRDCHLREALGIEYARSRFPAEHVCVNNQVPAAGPDSVVFPEIIVTVRGLRPVKADVPLTLTPMQPLDAEILLALTIHGIVHDLSAPVRLQLTKSDVVQVETQFDVKLVDFGIVVKMPPLMSVDDHTRVKLVLLLARQ
jgi:polyisoprenoid-binding protein YceI